MTTILNIHKTIQDKLEYFHKVHKIPNIIFHGPSGSGKKTILENFIKNIYNNDKEKIKNFVIFLTYLVYIFTAKKMFIILLNPIRTVVINFVKNLV